ncbi:MAG: fluoride efflux transporter CrcB [bacterium]|nr:fluoride efflux transporter CrcB [bacterium]
MLNCLAVGVGGFLGSVARYLLGMMLARESCAFPFNTFVINVSGSFLIGVIAALSLKNPNIDPRLVLMIKVGLCGGFTTFSTFSLETLKLLETGSYCWAGAYVVCSVFMCVPATFAAQLIIK